MSKKKILFVAYGGGHATMLLPLIKFLENERSEQYHLHVLGLTMARSTFLQHDIPCLGFRDFITPDDEQARAYGEKLAEDMHAEHTSIGYEESVAYLGLSYADLVAEHGEDEAKTRFEQRGRQCLLPIRSMQRIFDKLNPDIVVTTNSPRAEQAAREVAMARSIPTFALTDLIGNFLIYPLHADHIFIACAPAMDKYKNAPNVSAKHFHLVGNPAMDVVLNYQHEQDRDWIRSEFPPFQEDSKYIISTEQFEYTRRPEGVFQSWTDAEKQENLEYLYRAAGENNAVLLVRPHPSMKPDFYRDWVSSKTAGTTYLAAEQQLHQLIQASDLLISNYSTTMLDTLYLRRPVLLVEYPQSMSYLPFDKLGYAFAAPINDADKLAETIHTALEDKQAQESRQQKFESEFPALPCTPRIVEILESALRPK